MEEKISVLQYVVEITEVISDTAEVGIGELIVLHNPEVIPNVGDEVDFIIAVYDQEINRSLFIECKGKVVYVK